MSASDRHISAERLDAYLDGTLPAHEEAALEQQLAGDPQAMRQVEIQRNIDIRLRRMFSPPRVSPAHIEQLVSNALSPQISVASPAVERTRRSLLAAIGGLAAMVACVLLAWQWTRPRAPQPYFRPRPLTDIYRETVDAGFRPYYFCEDDDRFRMTFAKRQNVPLHLADMPADRRMIGLSYLGGLSRDTTAILGYAEGRPVIVFVDQQQHDTPVATFSPDPQLNVFRKQLGDLVLYEISPLETAAIMDFLEISLPRP